ncbi:hypothetical protein AAFF_G00372390 [Aldrovandia affinis]|uniref:Uncharacterized protein n=1 Tax=Aldrovandia affinis TaxID=143900 RepID=A0AAD7SGA9_9TELE|nr:hypothetical protein AAFF_G00372390 [Aldrovandia affinis]
MCLLPLQHHVTQIQQTPSVLIQITSPDSINWGDPEGHTNHTEAIEARQERMDALEESNDGVPLKLKYPDGLVKMRKSILSESIQVITLCCPAEGRQDLQRKDKKEAETIQKAALKYISSLKERDSLVQSAADYFVDGQKHVALTQFEEGLKTLGLSGPVHQCKILVHFVWSELLSPWK